MKRMFRLIILVFIPCSLLLTPSCGPQAPQRPSQRKGEQPKVDSAALALLELNQQLTIAADKQLTQFAQTQDERYALYEAGTWMAVLDWGDEASGVPQQEQDWTICMKTYNLDGKLLLDSQGTYRIGKQELPLGVEVNIGELHHGAKARMLLPWYAAYGLQGTENIPPYENVIIEIELK